jgi:hypothetical protein
VSFEGVSFEGVKPSFVCCALSAPDESIHAECWAAPGGVGFASQAIFAPTVPPVDDMKQPARRAMPPLRLQHLPQSTTKTRLDPFRLFSLTPSACSPLPPVPRLRAEGYESDKREPDRVRRYTATNQLAKLDQAMARRVRVYASQPPEVISERIEELYRESSIERYLQINVATVGLTTVALAVGSNQVGYCDLRWVGVLPVSRRGRI